MKKTIKIILIALLIMTLNFAILAQSVQATDGEKISIYTKGEFKRIIRFNGIAVKTTNAVYQKNGQEYPAYCLNKDLQGVGEDIATYDVTNQGEITDISLWRIIINGYPYKTLQQLGVQDEGEAYIATKQAIYCYIYNRGTEGYTPIGEAGNRVINAINNILANAKNSTESFENQKVEIIQSEKWEVEENYLSKEYEVKSNINISKFTVNLENQPDGSKITNLDGQEKNKFYSNEKFKVLIPIDILEESGEFKIKIQTEMETKPIFFGKAPSGDLQDYALTAFSYEDIDTELIQNYEENETKIIIEKQDSETEKILNGAKFEVLDENEEIIKTIETNENGQVILEHIIPGIYYIREIQAPDGYQLNDKIQKIEIKMNEKQTVKIKNNKIVIEEPKLEEPPVEEPEVKEELPIIEVPRLPVTGM